MSEEANSAEVVFSRRSGPVRSLEPTILPTDATTAIADLAREAGIRRVHMLAWRDVEDPEAGGSEIHMAYVASAWAQAGLDVTVRTSAALGLPAETERDGYRLVRKSGRYGVFPHAILSEATRRTGPVDAIVEAWNGVPFLTPLWFRGPKVTLIHHVHKDVWPQVLPWAVARGGWFLEGTLSPPIYRRNAIVTLSASSSENVIRLLGLPEKRITISSPGIDDHFCPEPKVSRSAHPLIVAVGRLMPPKRFDRLIDLAVRLREDHPDLELVIAGEGHERANLEAQIKAAGAEGWCTLPGRVDDEELVSLYRRAWVVGSTSSVEGWGMTLTEAAACGTPTVATRIQGHCDSVAEGISGLLGDTDSELFELFDRVLTDPVLRDELSEGARKHALAFSWATTAMRVFEPLAAQGIARRHRARS